MHPSLTDWRIGLRDGDGTPLPGYAPNDCIPVLGNATGLTVAWRGGADLSALQGRPVQVDLVGTRTKLYSFRFE